MHKEKNKVDFYKLIKWETRQFCTNTSLHGYKYIVQTDKYVITRVSWTSISLTFFVLSLLMVWWSSQYNSQHLIDTVAETVHNPIWNYKFPAISLCNRNKVSLRKLNNFYETIIKPPQFNKDYIFFLIKQVVSLLYLMYNPDNVNYYNELQTLLTMNNLTLRDTLMAIRPDCTELLRSCSWKGRIWKCDSLFEEISSVDGLCCTTNYYALRNKSFSGYLKERYSTQPRRLSACGQRSGYELLINNQPTDYFVSSYMAIGVKVIIHDSYDYPGWNSPFDIIPKNDQGFISITPSITYATDAVAALSLSERQCLFSWEKPLKYFINYSYTNCLIECRAEFIMDKCGCIPMVYWDLLDKRFVSKRFFRKCRYLPDEHRVYVYAFKILVDIFPDIVNETRANACDIKETICIYEYRVSDYLVSAVPGYKYQGTKTFDYKAAELSGICKCLPSCESADYAIETSRIKFSRKHAVNKKMFYAGDKTHNHSVISIYFKDLISNLNRKDINMNWFSELALFGGLLALFVGFSFTAAFEVIYYFTIKLLIDYIQKKKPSLSNKNNDIDYPKRRYNNFVRQFQIYPAALAKDKKEMKLKQNVPTITDLYKLKHVNNPWFTN